MRNFLIAIFLAFSVASFHAWGFGGIPHPAPPAIDGSAGTSTTASSISLTLSTSHTNDLIFVSCASNAPNIASITDTANLTWIKRTGITGVSSHEIEEWYAVSTGTLSSDAITINFPSSQFTNCAVLGVSGSFFPAPFDSNPSLPGILAASTITLGATNNPYDLILSFYRQGSDTPFLSAGTGFTSLFSSDYYIAQYKVVTATQSNLSIGVNGTTANTISAGAIVDAIQR